MHARIGSTLLALALAALALPATAQEYLGIPLKPDPPIAVDGDLGEWSDIPGALSIDQAAQVQVGEGEWGGPSDMSGVVRLAWRPDHLFLAANVVDDKLEQADGGAGLWLGDHVELYVDAQPDLEPNRTPYGVGQYQFGFSPGNFLRTGDALRDLGPEAFQYVPEQAVPAGVDVAAQRTADGWTLEAAIPWSVLGIERPAVGLVLAVEVALSDKDAVDGRQEAFLTLGEDEWARSRARLRPAVLAGSDGVPPEVITSVPVFGEVRLAQAANQRLTFTAPATPEGKEALLVLNARLDTEQVAGHTPALRLHLNGTALEGGRLVGKPLRAMSAGGVLYSMYAGDRLTTYYSPDFTSADSHPVYGLMKGVRANEFVIDVTDLLTEGENTLVVENAAQPSVQRILVAADARIEFRRPLPPEAQRAGPPTGEIPVIQPVAEHATDFSVQEGEGARLDLVIGGQRFAVESRFSTPKPEWVSGSSDGFRWQREVERRPEAVVIRDRFTNLTDADLPLMQRHEVVAPGVWEKVWLAGRRQVGSRGSSSEEANPTTIGAFGDAAIGLLPLSDVARVHVNNYALRERLGLADDEFVLRPNTSYTAEWAIVPATAPEYFAVINPMRRLLDVNFLIPGGFAFLRAHPTLTAQWSDAKTESFIRLKDALYVCATIPSIGGHAAHGTAFQDVDHEIYREQFQRRTRLVPEVQNLVYFHCFLDVSEGNTERFADAIHLRPDGTQADYGEEVYKLFLPLETNSYGPAVARNIDVIFDECGADGVYWDEHKYSRYAYHYGEPWDGVSADIDPETMQIRRRKSSVTLLTDAWRLAQARRVLARGPLVGNGAPVTREMIDLRFPCFVETGSITNCTRAQLYTPIALGDHLTERSELDAYNTMVAALDYGCVYHWYNDMNVLPTHPHLTRYMFPITPLELHEGYIIGEERIVTNRSGLFGWGDDSRHEVHVFNHEGVEVPDFSAPTVTRDGKTFTELRIGEGWSAAIVRQR